MHIICMGVTVQIIGNCSNDSFLTDILFFIECIMIHVNSDTACPLGTGTLHAHVQCQEVDIVDHCVVVIADFRDTVGD